MFKPNRRSLVAGAASLVGSALLPFKASAQWDDAVQHYGPVEGEPFPVAGINLKRLNPRFQRTVVGFNSNEEAGTIVIDPAQHFLYVVNGDGRALRYGVGVGRQGFTWSGIAQIQAKREWPDWYPPKEMIARDPHVSQVVGPLPSGIGLKGGVGNPLGARAMYLYQNGKDTLFRIHGTLEPYSIGTSVSSGCIRMINQDVIDLYERIPLGTKVIVLGDGTRAQETAMRHAPETDPQPEPQYDGDVLFDRDGNPVRPRGMGPMENDPYEGQY